MLVTHSKTDGRSMLSVSVIYFTVAANVNTVESSEYIDTQALFKVSGRSLVMAIAGCPAVHHTQLNLHERLPTTKTLCSTR